MTLTQRIFSIALLILLAGVMLGESTQSVADKDTPAEMLIAAASDGSIARMELAIRNGTDVNARTSFDWTALMLAVQSNQVASVRWLIAHHANVNAHSPARVTPLLVAAYSGNCSIVRILLDAGAELNAIDSSGRNALIFAAECPHGADVTRDLLALGLNPNSTDNDGQTPLMEAASCGNRAVAEALLAGGANLHLQNHQNQTAVDVAREACDDAMAKFLLRQPIAITSPK